MGLGLKVHVGHVLGLEHDLGLGVAQAISLVGITLGCSCVIDDGAEKVLFSRVFRISLRVSSLFLFYIT